MRDDFQQPVTTEKTEDPMVAFVVKEFERYEGFHRERFDEAEEIYDMWKNVPPKRSYDWQNAVNVPLIVEGEQTITPRIYTALFPTDAPVDVQVEGDAPEEQGIRIKGITQHYFRISDVQGEALPMLTQNTLLGTGYAEGGSWLVRKGYQYRNDIRYFATIESRPDCKFVDFFEMFPHPAKQRMDDGLPIIRRRYIDKEALKRLATQTKFDVNSLAEALNSKSQSILKEEYDERNPAYELLEYWGSWNETTKGEDGKETTVSEIPYWIIIVNRDVKLRGIPNPYNHQMPPYLKVKLFENPKPSWFGVGIGQVGKPTQERINKIVNQRLDNVDLVLNKQGFYDGNDPLINVNKLNVSKPGLWRKVSDTVASIRWMETPDVTASSYQEEALAKQDFRESTGATAHLMPEVGSEHRTALGIQILQGAAGMRFRPVLRKMETDFVQGLAMFYFSNLKQFMTEAEWIKITGKNGELVPIKISPEEIQAKVYFIPTGISETLNKETAIGQLLRFKEVTAQDPTVNRAEINKRIAELMGFKDINKLLTPMKLPQQGGLDQETQMRIQQRMAEGATSEQIKAEILGPRPTPQPQEGTNV